MKSVERVKAAIYFNDPDKVPVWNGWFFDDLFVLAPMPSKDWQPGHTEGEKNLFPHTGDDIIIKFDSPRMSGYNNLRHFGGKIMFWGCINIQSIYPKGTLEECEREAWHMIRNLGTQHGGFGAYFYSQPDQINIPKENIKAFKRGLKKYGIYSEIPEYWWQESVSENWNDYKVPSLPQKH